MGWKLNRSVRYAHGTAPAGAMCQYAYKTRADQSYARVRVCPGQGRIAVILTVPVSFLTPVEGLFFPAPKELKLEPLVSREREHWNAKCAMLDKKKHPQDDDDFEEDF